jgi:hypothetical protein
MKALTLQVDGNYLNYHFYQLYIYRYKCSKQNSEWLVDINTFSRIFNPSGFH